MNILLATSNQHKLKEVQAIVGSRGIEVVGLDTIEGSIDEPVEDADTFAGNARLKAIGYARATGRWCLADDSGLVVDALGGEPGVHSARFSGIGSTRAERDSANNALIVERLRDIPTKSRTARFICAMCFADPSGNVVAETQGTFEGEIIDTPRGANGFGYDPLFFLPEIGKTSAELTEEEKNALSHRGQAVRTMLTLIEHEELQSQQDN